MKTNNFNVKEKRDKRVILEEEKTKSSLLLLLFKKRKSIFIGILLLILCLLLISIGIGFSLFRGSNDYDITYITGSEQIETNKDPDIDDEDVEDELLGEIAREDGVVVLVKTVMTPMGEIISYYTDGTAVMISSKGKIYRVSTNSKGKYGVSEDGKFDKTAKRVLVTSTTSTLSDGTIITYYSDGTARVELKNKAIFVRDSNNISISEENLFDKVNPSGVALSKEVNSIKDMIINQFTDGTTLIKRGDNLLLVNKNTPPNIENNNINYDRNNVYEVVSNKTYEDGNTITHFKNGSATITDKKGNVFYVKNSADLLLKDKKLYEIMPKDKAVSISSKRTSNKINVVYFNNGAAIVIYPNNDRRYVEDSDDIIYEGNTIKEDFEYSKLISTMVTKDGKKAYSFENGKTQVIESDNTSYIVDTDTLDLRPIVDEEKPDEEDKEEPDEDDKEEPDVDEEEEGTEPIPIDPGEGLYITEAEHEYDDPLDVQTTTFVIKNDSTTNKDLRITIEEVSDYQKYNTSRLEPKYVKFQSTVGDDYVPVSYLTDNIWTDENDVVNYVIYDGVLKAKSTVKVTISLYIDYSLLNNSHQNKGFLGTIKVYVDG